MNFDLDLSFDSTTPEAPSNNFKYITVDKESDFIQEGLCLKPIEVSDDRRYFTITAFDANGLEVSTERQYFPNPTTSKDEKTYKKASEIKKSLLLSYARKLRGPNYSITNLQYSNDSFENPWIALIERINKDCAPSLKTQIRVKLNLVKSSSNSKWYTNISTFGPFENMNAPREMMISKTDKENLSQKLNDDSVAPDKDPNGDSGVNVNTDLF
jgi:hypothetical protein